MVWNFMLLNFIENNSLVINIGAFTILTLVMVLSVIKSRGIPFVQLGFFVLAALGVGTLTVGETLEIAAITDLKIFDLGISFFVTLLVVEVFIVMHVVFFYVSREENRGNRLYQVVPSNIDSGIYIYFDRYSEVLMYTEHFFNKIKMNDDKAKKWYKKAIKFTVDEKEFKYGGFLRYLRQYDEKEFNIVIEFNDFRKEEFTVTKTRITEKGKVLGYILVDKKPTAAEVYQIGSNKEFKLQLYQYFNSLNEAVGYYDNDINNYRLTEKMANRLGITELVIDLDTLKQFISEDDLVNFEKEFKQEKGTVSYRYRLKTVSGLQWHEEVRTVVDGIVYSVFRKLELTPTKVVMNTKQNLEDDMNKLLETEEEFGTMYLAINKVIDIINASGLDFANMVVDNYFGYILEEVLNKDTKIYRLSDFEFAIIINDLTKYDELVRNISANTSPLIKYDLFYGSTKYKLNNNIGLATSKDVLVRSSDALIKALEEALSLAMNEKYHKDFSIYVSKSIKDENYKFEDHVVDIDNKFLDE